MDIISKILAVLMAPFDGVWNHLCEHIETLWIRVIVYLVWCAFFGWILGLGSVCTAAIIYAAFHPEDSEE